jgi:Rhs element Vgr protein
LPIPSAHREFTVEVDGQALSREHHLLGVHITKLTNKLSTARLIYADGAAATSDFPLSNENLLIPGKRITIKAGAIDDPQVLFQGIIVAQSIRLRPHGSAQLIVECRHSAAKLTVGRKSAYHAKQTDSSVITGLLTRAGLGAQVDSTAVEHECLVQYSCTDWDFLLARAAANGLLVHCHDTSVAVQAPELASTPVFELLHGATLLEVDATMDAREQYGAVKGRIWDPAAQSKVEVEAEDPEITDPGNLGSAALAQTLRLDHLALDHVAITEPEARAWATAAWQHSQLGRIRGRAKCEGIGGIQLGDTVKLSGLGRRFSGNVYLTGIRHDYDLVQGWKTHIQFGSVEPPTTCDDAASAPKAAALVPGVSGLQIGVVTSNEDPQGEHRVQVRMPMVDAEADGTWARVATLDAGDDRGSFFRPEIGDEVLLGFMLDDPRSAVILGMLHSSAKPPPWTPSDDNHEKGHRSRSKLEIYFNDDSKVLSLRTPAGNSLTLSEEDSAIRIADQNGNEIELNSSGIRIHSIDKLEIDAAAQVTIEAGTSLDVSANTEAIFQGNAGVELSSPATAVVRGSMVRIN